MSNQYREFARAAEEQFRLRLSAAQLQAFERYARELQVWNQRVNLTAIAETEQILYRHFLDSLSCLLAIVPRPGEALVDVGTGAGFPGIPLKIACPPLRLVLIESIGKKAEFCRHIVGRLGLEGVEVVQRRAELVGRDPGYRAGHDWAVARAVARLPQLVEYLLPLLRMGGVAVAQKGESGPAEALQAQAALEVLGGEVQRIVPVELPRVAEPHYLIVIRKTRETPAKYPRRPGIVGKRPIKG